jgi:hypothetical protein
MLHQPSYPPDAVVGSGLQATWTRSRSALGSGAAQRTAPARRARSVRVRPIRTHARNRGCVTLWCAADPCQYAGNGDCDVPRLCATGDHLDCGTQGPVVSGTLPDAIGSLACRAKITRLCARPPTAALVPAAFIPHLEDPARTSVPTHSARRVFAGYSGLIGTVPSSISALTALTRLYVPTRVRISADAAHASECERVAVRGRLVLCRLMRVSDR